MITLQDLESAIAECQGERNPNANTCIKLAAFLTIRQEMFGQVGQPRTAADGQERTDGYSTLSSQKQSEKIIDYDSGSEFSEAINGLDAYPVWQIMDELLDVLQATNPRLYNGVLRKIHNV